MTEIGLTFGWTIMVVLAVIGLVVAAVGFVIVRLSRFDTFAGDVTASVGVSIFAITFVVMAITWFVMPDVNRVNYEATGTVSEVSNTFNAGTGERTDQGLVFEIDTVDDVLWTTDLRIQSMKGEEVELICTREWEVRAADWWNCRIGGELSAN